MSADPRPRLVGIATAGPPRSVQRKSNALSASLHVTLTWPVSIESAPYFAAFVANSCRASAKAWAWRPLTLTGGPDALQRLATLCAASASLTMSANNAGCVSASISSACAEASAPSLAVKSASDAVSALRNVLRAIAATTVSRLPMRCFSS